MKKQLKRILRTQSEWSQRIFGPDPGSGGVVTRGPLGPLKHLAKEAVEAQEKPDDLEEYADIFILLIDALRRAGFCFEEMVDAVEDKQKQNAERTWPDFDPTKVNEAVEHVRKDGGTASGTEPLATQCVPREEIRRTIEESMKAHRRSFGSGRTATTKPKGGAKLTTAEVFCGDDGKVTVRRKSEEPAENLPPEPWFTFSKDDPTPEHVPVPHVWRFKSKGSGLLQEAVSWNSWEFPLLRTLKVGESFDTERLGRQMVVLIKPKGQVITVGVPQEGPPENTPIDPEWLTRHGWRIVGPRLYETPEVQLVALLVYRASPLPVEISTGPSILTLTLFRNGESELTDSRYRHEYVSGPCLKKDLVMSRRIVSREELRSIVGSFLRRATSPID